MISYILIAIIALIVSTTALVIDGGWDEYTGFMCLVMSFFWPVAMVLFIISCFWLLYAAIVNRLIKKFRP